MIDGIYTAYLAGQGGQGVAMFVFKSGKIGGADLAGIVFRGNYEHKGDRIVGEVVYEMPAGSASITGMAFPEGSGDIRVPIDLPSELVPDETYRIETPIGPLNAKFIKNTDLEETDG